MHPVYEAQLMNILENNGMSLGLFDQLQRQTAQRRHQANGSLILRASLCPLWLERERNYDENKSIGYIVGGGLKENFRVRLTVPAQEVQEGAFVVIESGAWQYYGLVTDLLLGATDPRFADEQSETRLPPIAGQGPARTDAVHQPGSAARPDAGTRPGAGFAGI